MSLMWWIYLASVVDGLKCILIVIAVICGVCVLFGGIFGGMFIMDFHNTPENWKLWRKLIKIGTITFVSSLLLFPVVPTEKTVYMMVGAKASSEIIANPKVQETGGKVLQLINQKLDELTKAAK